MLVETDDLFCHQIVEPHSRVALNDPSWAERAFFTVSHPDRFGLDIGMSMYPNHDVLESYAIAVLPDRRQHCLRASRELSEGRWPLRAGPVTMDILEPQRRWRLRCEPNPSGISFDLEYVARARPFETRMPTLYRHHRLMYDNVIAFQPGRYFGVLEVDGRRVALDGVPGNRDRSWGVRASGEGRMRRGLVTTVFAEFPDVSILAMMYERHDGAVVKYAGAVSYDDGRLVEIRDFGHAHRFDQDSRQLLSTRLRFVDADGTVWTIEAEPRLRLHLAGAGYTSAADRRGHLGMPLWSAVWDLDDAALLPEIDHLNDNISVLRCGDRVGHGIIETLLGEHARYPVRCHDD